MTDVSKVNDSQLAKGGPAITANEHDTQIKGAAAAVSFAEIQDLFEMLEEQAVANKQGKKSPQESEEKLIKNISLLLNEIQTVKKGGKPNLETLSSQVKAFVNGDSNALGKILGSVMPAALLHLQNHPDDFQTLIKTFGPFMQENGEHLMSHLSQADEAFEQFQALYDKDSDPSKEKKLTDVMKSLMSSGNFVEIEQAMETVEEKIAILMSQDAGKAQTLAEGLYALLSRIGSKDGDAAKEFAKGLLNSGSLDELMKLSPSQIAQEFAQMQQVVEKVASGQMSADEGVKKMIIVIPVVFQPALAKIQGKNKNIDAILAEAIAALVMLQGALANSQAQQNKFSIAMNQAKTESAVRQMHDLNKQIQKEINAKKKAGGHWWSWLIKAVVAVVAAVVAAVTAGVGAAIAAALVGGFMSSPLMSMTVESIAKKISADLYGQYLHKYKSEGKSTDEAKQLAHQKADAVGRVIADVVVIVAVCIASMGVGGFQVAGEEGANAAVNGVADGATTAATEVAEEVETVAVTMEEEATQSANIASKATKFTWSSKIATKISLFQGLATVGASNLWGNAMQTDPEWCQKHKGLMEGLNIASMLVTMIATMMAGGSAMKAGMEGADMAKLIPSLYAKSIKYILMMSAVTQTGSGIYGVYNDVKTSLYLRDSANATKKVGEIQHLLTLIDGQISVAQTNQNDTTKQTTKTIQSDGQVADDLQDVAGMATSQVTKALLNA